MSSRDFGFLTLRNIQAFQSNGNPVPANQVLVTTGSGEGGFTNSLIISTICVSTVEVSTIFIDREVASSINATSITTSSLVASSINTNFLTVNSTTNLSTTIINNTLALVGNTPADSEIWLHNYKSRIGTSDPYGGLYLEASTTTSIWFSNLDATAGPYANIGQGSSAFYGSVNVASTLIASSINTRHISTFNISVQSTLTFYDSNLSSCVLDTIGSTLYVDGHPVITNAIISTVSTIFWSPGPNGTIYNNNIGTGNGLVGIGTSGSALQATLDVAGSIRATSYVSTNNIRMNTGGIYLNSGTIFGLSGIDNALGGGPININDTDVYLYNGNFYIPDSGGVYFMSTNTIQMNDGTINMGEGGINMTDGTINMGSGTITDLSTVFNQNGAPLNLIDTMVTIQNGGLFVNTPGYYISTNTINMTNGQITGLSTINGIAWPPIDDALWSRNGNNIYNDNTGNVGIGTNNPQSTLSVFGSCYISSGLTLDGDTLSNINNIPYGSLKIIGGYDENAILIQDGTQVNDNDNYNGYFIGNSANFGGASTFQIGRVDNGSAIPSKAIYMTQPGNVGINTFTPQFTLDVNGSISADTFLSTALINMSSLGTANGQIIGLSTINGIAWPPIDDALWSRNGNNIYNDNTGNVGIGTNNPQSTLSVFGSAYISSGLTLDGGGAGGPGVTYGSLKVQGGEYENAILIQDGTITGSGTYNGYFIGNSVNFGGASTFQIGRVDAGGAVQSKAIYMTEPGNVGINTFTPQFTLDVNGSISADTFLSTNTINMGNTNSNISFSSILNINSYSAAQDNGIINIGTAYNPTIGLGSAGSNKTHIINGNLSTSQNVGIGITPSYKLDVNGTSRFVSTYQNSTFTLLLQNQGATSTSTEIYMANGNGAYGIYATQSGGSPIGTGLLPSTFQIYSYYSNPLNILTLYPNGNLNVNGFITPTGTNGNRLYNNTFDTTTNITLSNLMPLDYTISNSTYVRLVILAIGGGGGGGGAFNDSLAYGGAGGGSGQEVTATYYVLPTAQLAITIGAGGAGGSGTSGLPGNNSRGTNGGTTIITSSNNATILVSAAGGNGADNNGLVAVNPDFGGNGYYGGGGGGGNDVNFINTGGASCVLYSVRTGNSRYIPATYSVAAAGGTGDGPAGPGTGGIGGTPNANTGYSGGGGASSALGTGGNGGNGSSNSNINGTNGSRGAGGGGGGQANSSYGNGGTGGDGCVQIQIFAL